MKLVYLINGMGAGGAERSLAELLPYLGNAGISTTVVCLRQRKVGVEADVRFADCELVFLPGDGRIQWFRAFRRFLASGQPDLVQTTLLDSHLVGRIAAAGSGIPVLSSLVNTPYDASRAGDQHLSVLGFRIAKELDRWTARHLTSHFHAITHAVRDAYVKSFGISPDRVTVIERGRSTARLGQITIARRESVRQALGLSPDQHVLINVGRQEFQKGQPALLEAVANLARRRPSLVLLIAGREGNLTPELRRLHARLGLGDRVRFLGYRTDVPDLLAASDIFVFPSFFEGLGGAVIEAMALGLPVVASDIPALREVVEPGRTADLVAPASAPAVAAAVEALLDSPERRAAYGKRARERFQERFEIGFSARRMIELYRSIARAPDPETSRTAFTSGAVA